MIWTGLVIYGFYPVSDLDRICKLDAWVKKLGYEQKDREPPPQSTARRGQDGIFSLRI
jgi:hypothetical protein